MKLSRIVEQAKTHRVVVPREDYIKSRRKGTSYIQQNKGGLTGFVKSCIGTAFYNMLLKIQGTGR
jgi:hypothetical protein